MGKSQQIDDKQIKHRHLSGPEVEAANSWANPQQEEADWSSGTEWKPLWVAGGPPDRKEWGFGGT